MATNDPTRNCPFCREEIKAEATKCRYCGSSLAQDKPSHKGTCPFCKEQINPEAIKCKHCGSNLTASTTSGCGCAEVASNRQVAPMLLGTPNDDPASFGSATGQGIFKAVAPDGEGAAAGYKCTRRIRCIATPWGPYCYADLCCYSPQTGTWACI
jgi:hypothetical protein